MPVLGVLLTNLFGGIVAWLAQYVTRKVAFGLAGVTAFTTITVALYVAFRGVLLGLSGGTFGMPDFWVMCLGIAIPPAASGCISSYMTIWTACTVYVWQRDLLHVVLKA